MSRKPKVILTDLGNVVIIASHAVTHAYLVNNGVSYDRAKRFFTIPEYVDFARGKVDCLDFYKAEINTLQKDFGFNEVMFYHNVHMYAVDDGVCDLIEAAANKATLMVATDTNLWQTQHVEQELLRGRKIVSGKVSRSNEIGQLKSEHRTFIRYAEMIGEAPADILFLDDRADLCKLAQEAGFKVHRFESELVLRQELMLRSLITP